MLSSNDSKRLIYELQTAVIDAYYPDEDSVVATPIKLATVFGESALRLDIDLGFTKLPPVDFVPSKIVDSGFFVGSFVNGEDKGVYKIDHPVDRVEVLSLIFRAVNISNIAEVYKAFAKAYDCKIDFKLVEPKFGTLMLNILSGFEIIVEPSADKNGNLIGTKPGTSLVVRDNSVAMQQICSADRKRLS